MLMLKEVYVYTKNKTSKDIGNMKILRLSCGGTIKD